MIFDDIIVKEDMDNIYSRNIPWEKLKGKVVLITGAYGMLASYVTMMLFYLNEYYGSEITIVAVVRSKERFRNRFGELADRAYVQIIESTLNEPLEYFQRVDYIIHAASHASGNYYKTVPVDVIIPNVVGTYYLLEKARIDSVDGFMLFSSGDIYGKTVDVDSITEEDFGILDPLDGHACYGESKRLAETMCRAYYEQYGVPATMIRIFPTYAPTMDLDKDPRAIASFVKDVVKGNEIILKSDGMKQMSFCYIADAVAGYFKVMLAGKSGEAYNVCNSTEMCTVKELAGIISSIEEGHSVVSASRSEDEPYLENNYQSWLCPSDKKLRGLGWKPQFPIKEGFSRVIDYFKGTNYRMGG